MCVASSKTIKEEKKISNTLYVQPQSKIPLFRSSFVVLSFLFCIIESFWNWVSQRANAHPAVLSPPRGRWWKKVRPVVLGSSSLSFSLLSFVLFLFLFCSLPPSNLLFLHVQIIQHAYGFGERISMCAQNFLSLFLSYRNYVCMREELSQFFFLHQTKIIRVHILNNAFAKVGIHHPLLLLVAS